MARVFLGVGSNIEPEAHIRQCATALAANFTNPVWSPVYQSPAIGFNGDDFLNAVVVLSTDNSIETLSGTLKRIELNNGRKPNANKYSSRSLDLDLLLYDDIVIDTPDVTLPRPEITSALHVLIPLVDLAPNEVHPLSGKTYRTLLDELIIQQASEVSKISAIAINL